MDVFDKAAKNAQSIKESTFSLLGIVDKKERDRLVNELCWAHAVLHTRLSDFKQLANILREKELIPEHSQTAQGISLAIIDNDILELEQLLNRIYSVIHPSWAKES